LLSGFLRDGVARASDEVLITNGCQQAIDLLVRTIIQPGDLALIEDPVYPGLREVLLRAGARLAAIPMTESGLDLNEVDRVLRRDRARMLVVTPTFQNPTGATLPLALRVELLRIAAARGVEVVENDIYSGLRYEGAPVPALKQLDGGQDVIQLGSFSKIAFPGVRVGWMLASRRLVEACASVRQWMDLHTDQFSQAILLRFAETGSLEKHRRRVVAAGAEKLAATLGACRDCLPLGSRFTRPEGGMNLWVRLPEAVRSADLLRRTEARGVSFLPGSFFAVARPELSSLRLSFAGLTVDQIRRGLVVLGEEASAELLDARPERVVPRLATAMV
jgi:2-aminoadipate transaminase